MKYWKVIADNLSKAGWSRAALAKGGVSGGGDRGIRDFVDGSSGGYGGDVTLNGAAAVAK